MDEMNESIITPSGWDSRLLRAQMARQEYEAIKDRSSGEILPVGPKSYLFCPTLQSIWRQESLFVDLHHSMGNFSGCYVLYLGDVCHYIGQSRNVIERLKQHARDGKQPSLATRVETYRIDFFRALRSAEYDLISRLRPIENVVLGAPDDYWRWRIIWPE